MRMHSVSSTIENGFVYIPEQAEWLPEYLHEMSSFPKGKYDDQVDSTSQALDWTKQGMDCLGLVDLFKQLAGSMGGGITLTTCKPSSNKEAVSKDPCCGSPLLVEISGFTRCNNCGTQTWLDGKPSVAQQIRRDLYLKGHYTRRRF